VARSVVGAVEFAKKVLVEGRALGQGATLKKRSAKRAQPAALSRRLKKPPAGGKARTQKRRVESVRKAFTPSFRRGHSVRATPVPEAGSMGSEPGKMHISYLAREATKFRGRPHVKKAKAITGGGDRTRCGAGGRRGRPMGGGIAMNFANAAFMSC